MCLGDKGDLEELKHSAAPLDSFASTLGTRGLSPVPPLPLTL